MKTLLAILLAAVPLILGSTIVRAEDEDAQPYIGEWSNGRGETLIITASTIQFADNKPVAYKDITKATDGNSFTLMLTSKGKLNYLSKFMNLTLSGEDKMGSEGYDSLEEYNAGNYSEQTWYRDK